MILCNRGNAIYACPRKRMQFSMKINSIGYDQITFQFADRNLIKFYPARMNYSLIIDKIHRYYNL